MFYLTSMVVNANQWITVSSRGTEDHVPFTAILYNIASVALKLYFMILTLKDRSISMTLDGPLGEHSASKL